MEEDTKNFIVRDSDQTKMFLWSAYEGYEEHFGNYIMYERIGRVPIDIIAGLHKYTIKFYYQVKNKLKPFETIKETTINKYKYIMQKEEPEKEDYIFIMEFIENFMEISGVKNITFKTDDPGKSVLKNR